MITVDHSYFERTEPIVWADGGTCVETGHLFTNTITHEWNHSLGETFTALIDAGVQLTGFAEGSTPIEGIGGSLSCAGARGR